jgi:hypothetical protein
MLRPVAPVPRRRFVRSWHEVAREATDRTAEPVPQIRRHDGNDPGAIG